MLVGALVLLAVSVLDAALDDVPRWLYVGMFFAGYVLLSYGFFTAMNARRGASTPRDRG